MNAWVTLVIAGVFEVFWALGIKESAGLTKLIPSIITVFFMIVSIYLLAVASREIPIGISYAIWAGIGTIGTFIGSIVFFNQKFMLSQIIFFSLIVVGVLGLKLVTASS